MDNRFLDGRIDLFSGKVKSEFWTDKEWREFEQAYLKEHKYIRAQLVLKRLFDIAIALLTLIILSPIFLLVALAIKFSSPGPILFCQERLGRLGKPFTIYKFRTMVDGAIHIGSGINTFKGDPRITSVGKFLREYHLDELPQLFNILVGEMSLVGPRPLLISTLSTYKNCQKKRLLMPPGLTAWEAVNGGLENSLDERIKLDIWYVNNWRFWLDIVIILRTIPVVLRKEGVYEKEGILTSTNQTKE
ncbi:sugar transferase [Chlorogloeopsis sp. ULAP01]|uniref:sugar transferase n=1 Tax=Chlorogloeopsis sp. ULAP01 TaxID=3056483 RepID=UPI0025AB0292|nr:sugar transferase [Chlorogloeopsis sp. ULAP01]MDM9385230.1 sugar transferase [Chlorogloeopsis sp. ULAP01]